ncbi:MULTISPECIES: cytochrome P450 [unclassified Lysobacter]|uniref:cytochrome P450 n=1 Tax=unclassified Lysobacter TaxID=2635362 RepID=UPI001BE84FF6|nr:MULTISPECIES: cytochrome P450 [unclassified Lysobacter]MBT2744894.1 cytochrome P450 [Lysobacter sp. ISL-42]MBT2752113.1 cytochrome P450 [Lysobacter sp. ISL-50]MBT2778610.1 cytochrome P450 [Lysobacter sp. ISL-54]MBT2780459.1 cytochrome P450 [Lysobacter sp. ISL-52]
MTVTTQEIEAPQETGTPLELFNPFLPGFDENPYEHYRTLRDTHPVQEHPMGFWFVSRHADVATLLRDARLSVADSNLGAGPMRDQYEKLIANAPVKLVTLLDSDPPDHTRLRSLVGKVFTPRSIAALEPMVTELVDESLDRIADAGSVNLIDALAFPLPFAVISTMLGMPDIADPKRLLELTETLVIALEPVADPDVMTAIVDAEVELSGMMREVIAWKRNNPADDLLTALIQADHNGDFLSNDELVAQILLLFIAGHHTTVNLIGNGVAALLRHPDQLALLRSNPDLIGNAVEEFLRYDSPTHQTRRITVTPYQVGGREIPAGAMMIACLGSANRDERMFGPDADVLRIDREQARHHVSFSVGTHHCLGSALARLEGRVAINRLVSRFPKLALSGRVRWNGRINLRGATDIPVSV